MPALYTSLSLLPPGNQVLWPAVTTTTWRPGFLFPYHCYHLATRFRVPLSLLPPGIQVSRPPVTTTTWRPGLYSPVTATVWQPGFLSPYFCYHRATRCGFPVSLLPPRNQVLCPPVTTSIWRQGFVLTLTCHCCHLATKFLCPPISATTWQP